MLRMLVIAAAFAAAVAATPARAQVLVESYTAFLSEADHFSRRSRGECSINQIDHPAMIG